MTRRNGSADPTYLSIPWESLPPELRELLARYGIGPGVRVCFTKRMPVSDETLLERFYAWLAVLNKRTAAIRAVAEEFGYCERHVRRRINGMLCGMLRRGGQSD